MNDNNEKPKSEHKTLFAKMASIMSELKRLPKNGYNNFHHYPYATDADVLDTIRQKMGEYNIAFFASMIDHRCEETTTNDGKTAHHIFVELEFTFACGDTGQTMTSRWTGESIDTGDKGTNKAATTGEKYFLLKTFMLSTGDLNDEADNTSPEVAQRRNDGSRPRSSRGSSTSKGKVSSNGSKQPSSNGNGASSNGTANGKSALMPWQHQEFNLTEIRNMYERWEAEEGSSGLLVEDAKKQLGSIMGFASLADYQTQFAEVMRKVIDEAEGVPF